MRAGSREFAASSPPGAVPGSKWRWATGRRGRGAESSASAMPSRDEDPSLSPVNLAQWLCDSVSSSVNGAHTSVGLPCGFSEVMSVKVWHVCGLWGGLNQCPPVRFPGPPGPRSVGHGGPPGGGSPGVGVRGRRRSTALRKGGVGACVCWGHEEEGQARGPQWSSWEPRRPVPPGASGAGGGQRWKQAAPPARSAGLQAGTSTEACGSGLEATPPGPGLGFPFGEILGGWAGSAFPKPGLYEFPSAVPQLGHASSPAFLDLAAYTFRRRTRVGEAGRQQP